MQQPPAIMQASEDLIEKGSKPAARLGRRIKSCGTLFTVHFVFVFRSASVTPRRRSVCMTEIQSGAKRILDLKKNTNAFVTLITAFHAVSMTLAARGLLPHGKPVVQHSPQPVRTMLGGSGEQRGVGMSSGTARLKTEAFVTSPGVCMASASLGPLTH